MGIGYAIGLLACLSTAGGADADKAKKDNEALQGTWAIVEVVASGVVAPKDKLKDGRFIVDKDRLTIRGVPGDKEDYEFRFRVDPSTTPKQIDLVVVKGGKKGEHQPGIYQLDGDTLTMCFPMRVSGGRPKQFQAPEGSGVALYKLQRGKK